MPIAASTSGDFDTALLVLGGLLAAGALLSALAHRQFLSLTAVFVLAGFLLGPGALGVLHFDPSSGFVGELALVALVIILFRDGLEVEGEMLQREWRLPLRKLVLAMPITAALVAVFTHVVIGFDWTVSFLLGALLAPTDPVLSSSVVTNPRVPRLVRHSLNLESGLNDGLALPAVLALSAAVSADNGFDPLTFVLQDVSVGLVTGVLIGLLAAWAMPDQRGAAERIPAHQQSLFALGLAFAAYGIAHLPPEGNGLIAVYVCAITFGIRRPDVGHHFEERAEDIVEVVKLGVFVVFGSLLTLGGLFGDGWAAVGLVVFTLLVARPVAIFAALAGTGTDRATTGFMAWFGPKGVATMTFSLLVLAEHFHDSQRLFNLAALTVFVSILAHGATDKPGVEWIARRTQRSPPPAPAPAA